MKFAAIYQSFMGDKYRRNVDIGHAPLWGADHYWRQFMVSPVNERDSLLCLVRLDGPAGEPEVIVAGAWTDEIQVVA